MAQTTEPILLSCLILLLLGGGGATFFPLPLESTIATLQENRQLVTQKGRFSS
jgi:hypothetical protein